MLITMSSSTAPSASARPASNTFVAVVWAPCGKPTTVPTSTGEPASSSAQRATSAGRAQTDATL